MNFSISMITENIVAILISLVIIFASLAITSGLFMVTYNSSVFKQKNIGFWTAMSTVVLIWITGNILFSSLIANSLKL